MRFIKDLIHFLIAVSPLLMINIECSVLSNAHFWEQLIAIILVLIYLLIMSYFVYNSRWHNFYYGTYFAAIILMCIYHLTFTSFSLEELKEYGFAIENIHQYYYLKVTLYIISSLAFPASYAAFIRKRN